MNRNQRIALCIGLALILAVALFPPYRRHGWRFSSGAVGAYFDQAGGRAFLFTGPRLRDTDRVAYHDPKIDGGRLSAELAVIAAATGLLVCGWGKAAARD